MTRDFATDPEVAEDLIRRARSERDRDRTREAHNPFGSDAIVEHWPCRGGCGAMVGVTREGIDALELSNRRLADRREQPIARSKVMWCPACKRRDDELAVLQRQAKEAARKPREQLGMQLDAPSAEPSSGMRTKAPRPRRRNNQ